MEIISPKNIVNMNNIKCCIEKGELSLYCIGISKANSITGTSLNIHADILSAHILENHIQYMFNGLTNSYAICPSFNGIKNISIHYSKKDKSIKCLS